MTLPSIAEKYNLFFQLIKRTHKCHSRSPLGIMANIYNALYNDRQCFHFNHSNGLRYLVMRTCVISLYTYIYLIDWTWTKLLRFRRRSFPIHIHERKCDVLIKILLMFIDKIKVTICQYWIEIWLGTEKATSHYLNQWWPNSIALCSTIFICVLLA